MILIKFIIQSLELNVNFCYHSSFENLVVFFLLLYLKIPFKLYWLRSVEIYGFMDVGRNIKNYFNLRSLSCLEEVRKTKCKQLFAVISKFVLQRKMAACTLPV
jgi:hypothetical protein